MGTTERSARNANRCDDAQGAGLRGGEPHELTDDACFKAGVFGSHRLAPNLFICL